MEYKNFSNIERKYAGSDELTSGEINFSRLSSMSETKNKDWYKYWVDKYISAYIFKTESVEEKLYKKYRGIRKSDELNYITNILGTENTLPVPDIPHVPLIRPFIDHLVSVNSLRPAVYNIKYGDKDAIKQKNKEAVENVVQQIMRLLQQSMQKLEKNPEQEQQVQAELEEKINKEVEKIHDFKTIQESVAGRLLDLAQEKLRFREKIRLAFLDKCVTGKQYYRCRLERKGELPEFEIINPTDIAFSAENVDYLNQCQFVTHRKLMTYDDVINKYGHLLTKEDFGILMTYANTYSATNLTTIEDELNGYMGSYEGHLIEVYEVEWKTNKKIPVKELKDRYEILTEEEIVIFEKEKKEIKYKYFQELHTCTRIMGSIYVKYGLVPNARRDTDNISKVLLSFNGKLYNSRNNPPLSLVKDLSDLQDHYDILWYKMLEMILLSGNKGITLIEELLPNDMSVNDWLYYRKLGVARLSLSQEGIHEKLIGQLGQSLQPYDDTLSNNGVNAILSSLALIEKTVSNICGIPPQALGQTQQYETKANAELSVTQGSITTEVIHKDHSDFVREALNDILHWSKIAVEKGNLKDYLMTEAEQQLIEKGWEFIDYNVFVVDSYKEEKNLLTTKQIIQEMAKNQSIDMASLVKGLNSNSINEVNSIITKAVEKMAKQQQMNMQAEQQAEQEKLKAEMQIKQAELEIKKQELQLKQQFDQTKLKIDDENKDIELAIKDRLATVEEGYLNIAQKEIEQGLNLSNSKLDSRKGRNDKKTT